MNRSEEVVPAEPPKVATRPRRQTGLTLTNAATFRDVLLAARDSAKPYEVCVRWANEPEVCIVLRVETDFVVLAIVDGGEQVFVRIEDVLGIYVIQAKAASEPAGGGVEGMPWET